MNNNSIAIVERITFFFRLEKIEHEYNFLSCIFSLQYRFSVNKIYILNGNTVTRYLVGISDLDKHTKCIFARCAAPFSSEGTEV